MRIGYWVLAFLAGELIGTFARIVFPPPPTWLFAASALVSVGGLCVIATWVIEATRFTKGGKEIMTIAYYALSTGAFAGYLVIA